MTPAALLASLAARGIRLEARPGGRLFATPTLGLTAADRRALSTHKPALLALLAESPSPPSTEEEDPPPPALGWPEPGFTWRYQDAHQCTAEPSVGPVVVPDGAVLVYQDGRPRPCERAQAVLWCWLGGERWYSVATNPPVGRAE